MTASELLAASPVQSISNAARILGLMRRNGEPNRRVVHDLIKVGAIRLVDPGQPIQRWTVASVELERYIAHGPRTGGDVVPLRPAS